MYNDPFDIDHFAIRTFKSIKGGDNIRDNITSNDAYIFGGTIEIPEKHLTAEWFHTTDPKLRKLSQRIFVSEIDETKLSTNVQVILQRYLSFCEKNFGVGDFFCKEQPVVFKEDYNIIAQESEIAAWTLLNGHRINHLAVSVPPNNTIQSMIHNLKKRGYIINDIGGEIKVSEDGMLHQGSTMSDVDVYEMKHDQSAQSAQTIQEFELPGCFMEFVQRDKFPSGNIREGFEANNALRIYDSTKRTVNL